MNIKGLLDYASKEQNNEEFKKSIRNLAESDQYQQRVRETYYPDDTSAYPEDLQLLLPASTTTDFPINSHVYKIKTKFPFLSHYDTLEKSLPEGFVLNLIKDVVTRKKEYTTATKITHEFLRAISPDDLKYWMTKFFYDKIKSYVSESQKNSNGETDADNNGNNKETLVELSDYLSEIREYIKDIEIRMQIQQENDRRIHMLEKRRTEFYEEICTTIEDNKEKQEIIPIYRKIRKVRLRLPQHDISDILKSIGNRYANRFIFSSTCLIAKSKAEELKSLLQGEPEYKQACISLIKNGVPKPCLTLDGCDLLPKLGFGFRFEKDLNF